MLPHWRTALFFVTWLCLTLILWARGTEFGLAVIFGGLPPVALEFVLALFGGAWQLSKDIRSLSRWIARQLQRLKP
jgi:hypothetical protein